MYSCGAKRSQQLLPWLNKPGGQLEVGRSVCRSRGPRGHLWSFLGRRVATRPARHAASGDPITEGSRFSALCGNSGRGALPVGKSGQKESLAVRGMGSEDAPGCPAFARRRAAVASVATIATYFVRTRPAVNGRLVRVLQRRPCDGRQVDEECNSFHLRPSSVPCFDAGRMLGVFPFPPPIGAGGNRKNDAFPVEFRGGNGAEK